HRAVAAALVFYAKRVSVGFGFAARVEGEVSDGSADVEAESFAVEIHVRRDAGEHSGEVAAIGSGAVEAEFGAEFLQREGLGLHWGRAGHHQRQRDAKHVFAVGDSREDRVCSGGTVDVRVGTRTGRTV